MDERRRLEQIAALLRSESTISLATTDACGEPRSTPLFYLADDRLCLYWFSSSASAHSRNVKRNAAAAASIYRPTGDWKEILGLQIKGRVAVVKDRVLRKAITETYAERFQLGKLFRAAIARSSLYVLRPAWFRYVDNGRHFGYKFEVELKEETEERMIQRDASKR
jgi:uncharacterized protein YhbP (UPF0306 family)